MINLIPTRIACKKHIEPFRAVWPKGFTEFGLEGLNKLLLLQEFKDETNSEPHKIERALDLKPICCRLWERNKLLALFELINLKTNFQWGFADCTICRENRMCFRTRILTKGEHLQCLSCLCTLTPRDTL